MGPARALASAWRLAPGLRPPRGLACRVCAPRALSAAAAGGAGYAVTRRTLAAPHAAELEVKRSKFLTTAWPVGSAEEAMELVASHSDASASHNCFAYRMGGAHRSSDDGEPSGTAGRPILSAIDGEGLDGVCVLVVRHFGGTRLGAGGLVRAYGGAARECLRAAPKKEVIPLATLRLEVPFDLIGAVYAALDQHRAQRLHEDYGAEMVSLRVAAPLVQASALRDAVRDATSGRVDAQPED